MSDLEQGFPRKVITKARQLGVHNDCLASSETACRECTETIFLSFDFYYGHIISTDDVFEAIVNDIIEDRKVDVL